MIRHLYSTKQFYFYFNIYGKKFKKISNMQNLSIYKIVHKINYK